MTKSFQDTVLDDITKHLGERILKIATDAHDVCAAAGVSDAAFTLRMVEIFALLFSSTAHRAWPNMSSRQLTRIVESNLDFYLKHKEDIDG